uniref:NADH dehydrogenase subunit 6 n=1 Tax=Strongyloides venezuelensis TaxID=75913 RepID=A0A0K0ETY0_STRVS
LYSFIVKIKNKFFFNINNKVNKINSYYFNKL